MESLLHIKAKYKYPHNQAFDPSHYFPTSFTLRVCIAGRNRQGRGVVAGSRRRFLLLPAPGRTATPVSTMAGQADHGRCPPAPPGPGRPSAPSRRRARRPPPFSSHRRQAASCSHRYQAASRSRQSGKPPVLSCRRPHPAAVDAAMPSPYRPLLLGREGKKREKEIKREGEKR